MSPDPTPTGTELGTPQARNAVSGLAADPELAALLNAPGGQGTPPATGPEPEPGKPTEVNWEQVLQRAASLVAQQKEVPPLPEGVTVESAPEHLRAVLQGFGYKPEAGGEETEGGEAAEAGLPVEQMAAAAIHTNPDYQADIAEALAEATTREERLVAIRGVNEHYADGYTDQALALLQGAGFALAGKADRELDAALEKIPGLVLPTDATDPAQAMAFLMSAQHAVQRKGSRSVAEAVAAERKRMAAWLKTEAARANVQQKVESGELVTAMGGGGAGPAPGTLEELRSIDVTTPEGLKKFREREQEFRNRVNK